jgi:hypothetical protein
MKILRYVLRAHLIVNRVVTVEISQYLSKPLALPMRQHRYAVSVLEFLSSITWSKQRYSIIYMGYSRYSVYEY